MAKMPKDMKKELEQMGKKFAAIDKGVKKVGQEVKKLRGANKKLVADGDTLAKEIKADAKKK